MRGIGLLLNLIWFIFGGWAMAIQWFVGGLIMALTIVGLPFVPGIWKFAIFSAFPFGQRLVSSPKGVVGTAFSGILNIVWMIFAGIWIAISHFLAGILWCLTLIGIPFGIAHFKLAGAALMPVGKDIVSNDARTVGRLVRIES